MHSAGIHHITAIAGDPQTNLDFYTETLGLHLVKRTVNFDDPGSYHFYFGDDIGRPGTIITFFPWPGARRGSRGSGQVTAVSFAVSPGSIAFWKERLRAHHVAAEEIGGRFGRVALRFLDPHGLQLELIESQSPVIPSESGIGILPMNSLDHRLEADATPGSRRETFKETPRDSSSPFHSAQDDEILGFAAPTLEVGKPEKTEKLLTEILGFEFVAKEDNRRRFRGSGSNAELDLVTSEAGFGQIAVGSVHHIAFRAADDEEQLRFREQLVAGGVNVTPVIDRQYFHSIYFREPNGILFEIATDGPGFLIDESPNELGETLKLPPMYESARSQIERVLPRIELHHPSTT